LDYNWPGNVRELEHLLERSVLMTNNTIITEINFPQDIKSTSAISKEDSPLRSLEQNEREHILAALKKSNGRVRGSGGAAEILELPPTTLHSKMKKLGIKKTLS
jgi:transcriptional regulator with GAF, ATPase, and Fis domain